MRSSVSSVGLKGVAVPLVLVACPESSISNDWERLLLRRLRGVEAMSDVEPYRRLLIDRLCAKDSALLNKQKSMKVNLS